MNKTRSFRFAAFLCFATLLALAGCGGGSGGNAPTSIVCNTTGSTGSVSSATSTSSVSCAPLWVGTKLLGAPAANTGGYATATDSSGNVYVAGYTTGNLDNNILTGTRDLFLTKYDSGGTKRFTRQLGTAGVDTVANAVTTDSTGNVYVAGYTTGSLDGNMLAGTRDLFLTKYDSNGIKVFTRQLGATAAETAANAVASDSTGNVYVAGYTKGNLDGNILTGTSDIFLTKYDRNGNRQFSIQLGVIGGDTAANAVATDSIGHVYLAGYTTGNLDNKTLTGATDLFITKYDSNGIKLFTELLGSLGAVTGANSVALDLVGNVYLAGYTTGNLDNNILTGTSDLFLAKYDSGGNKLFTRQLGVVSADTNSYSVAIDSSGNAFVTGETYGGLDGNTLAGSSDLFLAKYNSGGNKLFTRQLGIANSETTSYAVAIDSSGNVFVTGETFGGLDGNTFVGRSDMFAAKYSGSGVKQ